MKSPKSVAGHVLATGDATPEEARLLAGSVLGNDPPVKTDKTKEELQALLKKIEGKEGQGERASLIRRQLAEG